MEPTDTNPFDGLDFNNPPPDTALSSKYLDPDMWFEKIFYAFQKIITWLFSPEGKDTVKTIFMYFALFFFTVIGYVIVRLVEIRRKERHHLEHELAEYAHHQAELERAKRENKEHFRNERWAQVLQYLFSSNENDWRLAILEADSMLEGLLNQLGFVSGETLADKLKAANQETFRGLSKAWEVHTIRNRIAHEGSNFNLSPQEAKRVIAIYEDIFREYGYI